MVVKKMAEKRWEMVARGPHLAIPDVSKMSLPAQILFRAAQHFASKAASGADVVLKYDVENDKPFLECRTKSSWLTVDYDGSVLSIRFVRRKGAVGKAEEVKVKQVALRTTPDTARDIVYHIALVFADAICNLYIYSTPELDRLFNLPPSQ
jgi:hypothetical protein